MSEEATKSRTLRKTLIGVVTSAKMEKTRRVEVPRLAKHAKYGKYLKRNTVCMVHDEKNESKAGDSVEIMETRPMSKLKRWRLVRVVAVAKSAEESAPSDSAAGDEAK